MPPRRSSRGRASVEPQPVESAPMKRKRSQPIDIDDLEEKENVAKPPSRARRSSSAKTTPAPSARSRASARARESVLEDLPETEDETDAAPPMKRKRPSLEAEDEEHAAKSEEDEDEEEYEDVKPKGRKSSAPMPRQTARRGKPFRVAATQSRSTRGKKPQLVQSETEDEDGKESGPELVKSAQASDSDVAMDDEDEDAQPVPLKKKGRSTARASAVNSASHPSSRRSSRQQSNKDEEEDDDDDEVAPIPPKKKGRAAPKASGSKPTSKSSSRRSSAQQAIGEEEEEEEGKPVAPAPVEEEEEEEEEKSLLMDAPPVLPPTSQPQVTSIPEEPEGPHSRLVIHKLVLNNFKSYAGRQEIGPFHKSFSSIVGANGSGKSNTIDALLFVFGYRATKMRQARLSELIHNSARYPDLDECSVEVVFRDIIDLPGPDAFEIVPNSQLIVARHAYRNNSSTYTINGRNSSFSEVQMLLKGRGIDLDHKRFLILQGEVESIAQMKPKGTEHDDGLLEYLEDIIGTSKYKQPIDDALVEMEALQEDRSEKLNRLRLVEKEKNSLEEKKKEAVDYLKLQNEHVRAQSKLYQWYIWQTLQNDEKLRMLIERSQKQLDEETEKNKDDVEHLKALQSHYAEREEAYKEVRAAAIAAQKELADHEKQNVELNEHRKHAAAKSKKVKKSLSDATTARKTAQNTIEDSTEKIEKEKKKLAQYEVSLDEEEKILAQIQDSLKDKTQKFYEQKEALQKELQPWTAKMNAKQAEIDVATGERDALVKKAEAAKAASDEAEENLAKLKAEHVEKTQRQADCKSRKAQLKSQKEAAQKRLATAQEQEKRWRAKASAANQRVQEAKASQAETKSQGKVLDSLTRLRDSGRMNGFHGRLGSLGTIPSEFDVAISTACSSLNNLVVDTVDQGQACIEYLRNQNIGRASFMVIEKINYPPEKLQKIQTPENVPRLFDLIKPKEPRFAPVFYKAISDTLVAKDMEQANRIAFGGSKRWRVVTLSGQLIDISGTMSGGGTQVARGGMSSKLAADSVSPQVLKGYEQESQEAARELENASREVRQAEAELEEVNKAGPAIDLEYEKLGLDITTGSHRITEAEKRVRDLKSHSKPDATDVARISVLDKSIATFSAALEQLQERANAIEASLKEVEDKILQIGGSKLLAQKSKVEGIRNHINLTNDTITNAEVAKAKAEKDLIKYDSTIETDTKALKEADAQVADFDRQLADLGRYVAELEARVEEAQTAEENSREDLDQLRAELEEKAEQVEAFKQTENKIRKELAQYEKDYKENEQTMEHWQTQHDELVLEEIDDDDEDDDEEDEESKDGDDNGRDGDVRANPDRPPKKKHSPHELRTYTTAELSKMNKRELNADVQTFDDQLKRAKPNLSVLDEYKQREEEYFSRLEDLEKVTQKRDAQKKTYDDLRKQRLDEFMTGFSAISLKLKEMYQMITIGGNAELELVDSMDPFSEGIIFSVMPPKKSWKNISNLSGGEKTLSSLALVFALHVFKPTPLYFMDEIDAALDFRNVSIVANYIKDRTKNAQFIIISLRNDMFEMSHRLIGIYKTANATQSISIDNHDLNARPANANPASGSGSAHAQVQVEA